MTDEELSGLAMQCWPADWPGQSLVELDNLGDPGAYLSQWVVEPCLDRLTEGEVADDDPLAESLTEDYLAVLEQNAFSPPWEFGDDPKDPKWIAECEEAIRKEFIAFLRAWRQNMKAKMSQFGNE